MPVEYDPKKAETAWPEADYPAVLVDVKDDISKTSKKPMEVWTFTVYDDANGREQTIKEYVTAAAAFKIRQLAAALGQSADFKAGKFHAQQWVNAQVMLTLNIEQSAGFDDKNRVVRFGAMPATAAATNTPAEKILNVPRRPRPAQPVGAGAGSGQKDTDAPTDEEIPF